MLHRRDFLKSVPAFVSLAAFSPRILLQAADQAAKASGFRKLIVVQLTGGNDGLNTVIPYGHDAYRKARPKLAIPQSEVLRIDDEFGFHPSFGGFAELLEQNQLAIVQGVGYASPNRSHFESMDIWHTCRTSKTDRSTGWLGRFLDQQAALLGDVPAIHLGSEPQPLALAALQHRTPSIQSLDQFQLQGEGAADELDQALMNSRPADSELLSFLQDSTASALRISRQLEEKVQGLPERPGYPATDLGRKLQTIAGLILSGLSSQVYYVQLDGFDTHSRQAAAHSGLLRQLGDAVAALFKDLGEQGEADSTLVMCFSEFGRRVAENASEGTDHGTAAPVFLAGPSVQSGLIGELPSLSDLDDGDLKFHTDFRCVYASVLENWLQIPSDEILQGSYAPVDLFRAGLNT